jgi:hypothetical protein
MGCTKVSTNLDWNQINVEYILKHMTSMTSTLTGEFGKYAETYAPYSKENEQAKLFDNWYVLGGQHLWNAPSLGKFDNNSYIANTAKNIAKPLKPLIRFYLLKAGQDLKPHVDFKTKSCIKFVYQKSFSSIVVEGVAYPYGAFILDNTKMHGVPACGTDRFIISFSFGEKYAEVVKWHIANK